MLQRGKEYRKIIHAGYGYGQIAYPVGVIIEQARLIAQLRPYFAGIGNGAALLRVFHAQPGKYIGQAHGSQNGHKPADD